MLQVSDKETKNRLVFDNAWWDQGTVAERFRSWPKRAYMRGFHQLVAETSVNRAVVLLGPRRVGKTVIIHQTIQQLIDDGISAKSIMYVSVDTPVYSHLSLESLLNSFLAIHTHTKSDRTFIFFDEIQYHKDWERHLKSLVDSYPNFRFVASGSAAAALRMKSVESGAGRFTDFLLPPLTFFEFIDMSGFEPPSRDIPIAEGTAQINKHFIDYLNYGGFPEAVFEKKVRDSMDRYIANDIIDKVLLRDLPSLYGIADTSELNRLFSVLAYNTGAEINLEGLSQSSNIAKNTLRRYLDYLEAAFLLQRVHRVDENARRFRRATHFKIYLTNPCIRAALFGAVAEDDEAFGRLVETAFVSQLTHSAAIESMRYARWPKGEVDFVFMDVSTQKPLSVAESKWSDRAFADPKRELSALIRFCKNVSLKTASVFTRSVDGEADVDGVKITFTPAAVSCLYADIFLVDGQLSRGLHPRNLAQFATNGASGAAKKR